MPIQLLEVPVWLCAPPFLWEGGDVHLLMSWAAALPQLQGFLHQCGAYPDHPRRLRCCKERCPLVRLRSAMCCMERLSGWHCASMQCLTTG